MSDDLPRYLPQFLEDQRTRRRRRLRRKVGRALLFPVRLVVAIARHLFAPCF